MDDSLQLRCPKCKAKFRDRARRVVSGYSRQCPTCEAVIFFEDGMPNEIVRDALKAAERLRRAMREAEAAEPAKRKAFVHKR